MDASGVNSVDCMHARHDRRNDRASQFMDDLTEARVLLRRTAYDGERPDGAGSVIDSLNVEDGEVVSETVVTEVVAERALGQEFVRFDRTYNAEIHLGRNRKEWCWAAAIGRRVYHLDSTPAQRPGERQFRHPLGQRHDRGECQGR